MSDTISKVTYSQNGKLYAGMQKNDVRVKIDMQEFKTDKKREKAYNKQIKIFDYADGLVDGVKDGVISEEEILAYDKKEKTRKTWKTIGLIAVGVGIAATAAIILHKNKSTKAIETITKTAKADVTNVMHDAKPSAEVASFQVKTHHCEDLDAYRELYKECGKLHNKRMALYSTPEQVQNPTVVSLKKMKAIKDVQYEMGEYFAVKEKMRKGIQLNDAERKFYDRIVSQMDITTQERTLWRKVTPYEGFEQEIRTGRYKFKGLTSTSRVYSDFFDFWSNGKYNPKTKTMTEGYMLQITVPKGKKLLDCNSVAKDFIGKTIYPRMYDEVVLPEGVAQVVGIDNVLNIIKMVLL